MSGPYGYVRSEPGLFTVGFYGFEGKWHAHRDCSTREEAADEVARLNGDPSDARVREIVRAEIEQAGKPTALAVQYASGSPEPVEFVPGARRERIHRDLRERRLASLARKFAAWRAENGFSNFDGDAQELLAELTGRGRTPVDRNAEQVRWLEEFCREWEEVEGNCPYYAKIGTGTSVTIEGPSFDRPWDVTEMTDEQVTSWVDILNAAWLDGFRKGAS